MESTRRQTSKRRTQARKPKPPRRGAGQRARTKSAERVVTDLMVEVLDEAGLRPLVVASTLAGTPDGVSTPPAPRPQPRTAAAEAPAPAGFAADATDKLEKGAQAFGEVILAIGNAVVVSQAALDDAAIETAKQLSETKLKVTVAIRQPLNDDGDLAGAPQIDAQTVSLSSYILPTLHQWQHVAVSMDLTVSEIDATSGLKVKSGSAGATVSAGIGFFSASGEFNYSSLNAESRLRSEFSNGAVRLDALLGPRDEFRFPEVADFALGPQILVTQAATEGKEVPATGTADRVPPFRRLTLTVKLYSREGDELTDKSVDLRLPPELRRRLVNPLSGARPTKDPIDLTLAEKFLAEPAQTHRVQLKYGDLTKIVDVTI